MSKLATELPAKGRWVRITEPMKNGIRRIFEGPVWYVSDPNDDSRLCNKVRIGAQDCNISFTIGSQSTDMVGPAAWEYITPPEPEKNGACWVIPHDHGDVIIWQRKDGRLGPTRNRWYSNGNGNGLPWTAIIDAERGYLLEVKRDS